VLGPRVLTEVLMPSSTTTIELWVRSKLTTTVSLPGPLSMSRTEGVTGSAAGSPIEAAAMPSKGRTRPGGTQIAKFSWRVRDGGRV